MRNEYEFETRWDEYARIMAREALDLPSRQTELDLRLASSIRIGDTAAVIRAAGNGVELAPMVFGFPPPPDRRRVGVHFKSEGRHFGDSNRCLIPASSFFEFTGSKYPKTRHRFWMVDQPCFAIAGLWRDGESGPAFTMLTTLVCGAPIELREAASYRGRRTLFFGCTRYPSCKGWRAAVDV